MRLSSCLKVRNEFYKDTQGVILVYDVGQKDSFDALDAWLAEMKQELGPHGNMENIIFVVCANKVTTSTMMCPILREDHTSECRGTD